MFISSEGTRKSKGYGYVTFAFEEDAQKAKDTVKILKGRPLSILFSEKKPRTNRPEKKTKENCKRKTEEDNIDDVDDHCKSKKQKLDNNEVNNNEQEIQGRIVAWMIR